MLAIDRGPQHLPADLFCGSVAHILRGMKVHANTISHARLVALEDSFPRTLHLLGHERFNTISREYLELPLVPALVLAMIGRHFPAYLASSSAGITAADLARFEWQWLQSFHAAEAAPLELSELAGIDPDALLDTRIRAHPAAWGGRIDRSARALLDDEITGLSGADAVLLTRPHAEVLVLPASIVMVHVLAAANNPTRIGNLFDHPNEQGDTQGVSLDEVMPALIALIHAGAIVATSRGK